MSVTAKSILVVAALLIVMTIAWHFIAVALRSNFLASILTNSAFCVLLAASVYRSRAPNAALVRAYVRATVAAISLGIGATFVGMLVYDSNHTIGDALMQSISLGFYPSGPDAPFEIGAILWGLSIALLIYVSVATGVAIRKVRHIETN